MKQQPKDIAVKIITLLIIGAMGLLTVNKAVYLHTHKLSDGTLIEHAHPFDKNGDSQPYKSHQHTNAELFFFQNINTLFLVFFSALALITLVKARNILIQLTVSPKSIFINLSPGRAPPIS